MVERGIDLDYISKSINIQIETIFDKNSLQYNDSTEEIKVFGKCIVEKAKKFIDLLKIVFRSEIAEYIKIVINTDFFPITITDFSKISLFEEDIIEQYSYEKVILYIDKAKLIEKYKDNYRILNNTNFKVYFNDEKIYEKINNSKVYLEDLIDENKYSIFLVINETKSLIYNSFAIINEEYLSMIQLSNKINNYSNIVGIRRSNIRKRNELVNWINSVKWITPIDLYTDEIINTTAISDKIMALSTDLIIKNLANITIKAENKEKSIFISSKRVEVKFDSTQYSKMAFKNLFDVYHWVYSESTSEKIVFLRNIIISMVVAKCQGNIYQLILNNSDWILKSTQEAYDEFVGESVEKYFESRFELVNRIQGNIQDVNMKIEELMSRNINNALAFVATIATGLLTYSLEDNSSLKIMKVILLGYCIVLIINNLYIIPTLNKQLEQIKEVYQFNIEKYDEKFRFSENLNLEKKHFNVNEKCIRNTINIMRFVYWAVIIIIIVLVFYDGALKWIINLL